MPSKPTPYSTEDVDLPTLGRALWRAKGWILALTVGAGVVTFVGLSMVRPLYTSESRVLVENDISVFTRPATDQGRDYQQQVLDEQAIQSQVQVLTSRDLALEVAKALDLPNNPEFAKDAGVSLFKRLLNRMGIGRGSPKSELEKAVDAFEDHLSVYALNKSSVIAIDYTSGDPSLAAEAANKLAEVYLDWQRKAKLDQTKDASLWLNAQIQELRKKVTESEEAVEKFRASSGLYQGTNNVNLSAQQLSELNSQLILAAAQKSEVEARARLIRKMLDEKGDIDATPEVLKSDLIGRLIEQRVQVQRQLAELSATLMPSHPRIKQLNSELADVRSQIRDEAAKIVRGLENEAEVASARETSLRSSLNDVKSQASGQSDAEIKLRALEREAKANRDLLESYLARYRDAAARHDMGSVPANATIVSQAHASTKPSFPKIGPMTLLVMAATALLSIAYVLARELMGTPAPARLPRAEAPIAKRRQPLPSAPPSPTAAPELPLPAAAPATRASSFKRRKEDKPPPAQPSPPQQSSEALAELDAATDTFVDWLRRTAKSSPREEGAKYETGTMRRDTAARATPPPGAPLKQTKVGPVLKSLDAVVHHIESRTANDPARAVLVAPVMPSTDASGEAVEIARALSTKWQPVVLVDCTRSAVAVSGVLGLPRVPGLTDLAARHAGFEDVVHVDAETPLQVIPAGNPTVRNDEDEDRSLLRIFDALSQIYRCVVLHADANEARRVLDTLGSRIQVAVAVVAPGATSEEAMNRFAASGRQVVGYEQAGTRSVRRRLLGRLAAT